MLVHQQVTLSRPHITSTQPSSDFSHGGRRLGHTASHSVWPLPPRAGPAPGPSPCLPTRGRNALGAGPQGQGWSWRTNVLTPVPRGTDRPRRCASQHLPPAPLITCSRWNPGPWTLMSVCLHPPPLCSFIPTFGISPEQSARSKSLSQPLCSQENADRDETAARGASALVTYMSQPLRDGLHHLSGEIPRG